MTADPTRLFEHEAHHRQPVADCQWCSSSGPSMTADLADVEIDVGAVALDNFRQFIASDGFAAIRIGSSREEVTAVLRAVLPIVENRVRAEIAGQIREVAVMHPGDTLVVRLAADELSFEEAEAIRQDLDALNLPVKVIVGAEQLLVLRGKERNKEAGAQC